VADETASGPVPKQPSWSPRPSLSVVLPAYNAADCVASSIWHLRSELSGVYPKLEIVVVDDGSTDQTHQLAEQAGADQVIVFSHNKGKGAAVRAGVQAASCDVIAFTDVDLSYGPDVIRQVVDALLDSQDGVQVCVGSRSLGQKNSATRMRQAGSTFIGWLARTFLRFQSKHESIDDTQCGIKAFEKHCAKRIFAVGKIDRFAFDIELFHIMFSWGIAFKTVEVSPRATETSTVKVLRDGFKTFVDIVRIARFQRAGAYSPIAAEAPVSAPPDAPARAALARSAPAQPAPVNPTPAPPANPAVEQALDAVVKSYDIRGKVPVQLNEALTEKLGLALAQFWQEDDPTVSKVLCGRDMRSSGEALAQSFMQAVSSRGLEVIDLGLVSTDMLYFASGSLDVPGAVFTASHNPPEYNGIKVCRRQAAPIGSGTGLERVKQLAKLELQQESNSAPATISQLDILPEFVQHVISFVDVSKLKPLRVVVDCANGMASLAAPAVLKKLPFEMIWLYQELDGTFPNHPADPLNPENLRDLQAKVLETSADLGIAFDGDGDRVFFVDEQAVPLSGSVTLGILASAVLAKHSGTTVLHNVVCSRAVAEIIREKGGQPLATKVGHSHIKAQMSATGVILGGEHSGHFYFRDNFKADSGIIAAVILLELLSQTSQALSQLRQPCERYFASGEQNFEVPDAAAMMETIAKHFGSLPQDRLDGLSVDAGTWWFNVRPSQTEPLLRVNLEATTADECQARLAELSQLIQT